MFKRLLGAAMSVGLVTASLLAPASVLAQSAGCGMVAIAGTGGTYSTGAVASDTCLVNVITQLATQAKTQAANLSTNQSSTAHLLSQIQNWQFDHNLMSASQLASANQLVSQIKTNTNLITSENITDQAALQHFQQFVPNYTAGQDYQQYLVQQHNNEYSSYAAALGVSDTSVQNETQVMTAVQRTVAVPPQNELQALQQLVALAQTQVTQMDSLLKIQASMMKSMAVAFASHMNSSPGGQNVSDTSKLAALHQCLQQNPFIGNLPLSDQQSIMQACQQNVNNNAAQVTNQ